MNVIESLGASAYASKFEGHMLPGIRLTCKAMPLGQIPIGMSRIGGLPDLPAGMPWPTASGYAPKVGDRQDPLMFLAQINLADIAEYDPDNVLPHSGLLLFFAATWVNDLWYFETSKNLWHVEYVEDLSTLVSASAPTVPEALLTEEEYGFKAPQGHVFTPVALDFSQEMTLPQYFDHPDFLSLASDDECYQTYLAIIEYLNKQEESDEQNQRIPVQRMLGHAQLDQNYAPSNDAILLLQLRTDMRMPKPPDASDLYWEFAGRGCFFIQPEALRAGDYSDVELVHESG